MVTAIPFVDQEQRVVGKVTMILQSAWVAVMGSTVAQEKVSDAFLIGMSLETMDFR